jgi:hypothetical protein
MQATIARPALTRRVRAAQLEVAVRCRTTASEAQQLCSNKAKVSQRNHPFIILCLKLCRAAGGALLESA